MTHAIGQANYAPTSFGFRTALAHNPGMDYAKFRDELGKVIRRRRKERELTQVQFAKEVGIDQANITRLERGLQGFDSETIFRIAQALGCTLTEIFYEVEQVRAPHLAREAAMQRDESLRQMVDSWSTLAPAGHGLMTETLKIAKEHFAAGKQSKIESRGSPNPKGPTNARPRAANQRPKTHLSARRQAK